MDRLDALSFVVDDLKKFIDSANLKDLLNKSLAYEKTFKKSMDARFLPAIKSFYQQIIDVFLKFDTILWTDIEKSMIDKLEFNSLFGKERYSFFKGFSNHLIKNEVEPIFNDIVVFNASFDKLLKRLDYVHNVASLFLRESSNNKRLEDNVSIVEINFLSDVSINNFKDAKEQMAAWFFIIEGYSRLLGIERDKFEIVGLSKNSPTNVNVKVELEVAKAFLDVTLAILMLHQFYITNSKMVKDFEKSDLISKEQKEVIVDSMKQNLTASLDEKIDVIVDEKMAKYAKDKSDDEIKTILNKGIRTQFNFIVNGGNVNLHFQGDEETENVKMFEDKKREIQALQEATSIKLIEESSQEEELAE